MVLADEYKDLIARLTEVHSQMDAYLQNFAHLQANYPPQRIPSVNNLLCYLFLRQHDQRDLQERLSRLGLSSLGRAESHVRFTLQAVLRALHALAGSSQMLPMTNTEAVPQGSGGKELLQQNTVALLGPARDSRATRVMVTMPAAAAEDPELIADWLRNGMDVMRINCAHDNQDVWLKLIANLRTAEKSIGRRCPVCMDLAGPKLRTGPLQPLPGVVKLQPQRDELGKVIAPAKVWLHLAEDSMKETRATDCPSVPLCNSQWMKDLQPGDRLYFSDARQAQRCLTVKSVEAAGIYCETERTCYLIEGVEISAEKQSPWPVDEQLVARTAVVGQLPHREASIPLFAGSLLILTRKLTPGETFQAATANSERSAGTIGCTLPEIFQQVQVGERVMLDDGKFAGQIEQVDADKMHIRITRTPPGGGKLKSDKGINFPDATLALSALTDKDLQDLPFIVRHADMVAYSFANTPHDVRRLQQEIGLLTDRGPAIVLKIETKQAFANLPLMLLEAMHGEACGVMIARGDLAVECGFERLAEIQEEILWICEAAHVPVIWATQVLESLAKSGLPSRAEITDAAMGHRAECVMLNKGPHITHALQTLDNILCRMESHQSKKSSMLRELQLAHGLSGVMS